MQSTADWIKLDFLLSPPITTEVLLPESLFRRLQALLDERPTESIDSLLACAIAFYLQHS